MRRFMTLLATLGCLAATLWGHPDDPKILDMQPPYRGPDFVSAKQAQSPIDFARSNVTLLSWFSLERFGDQVVGASDIWGYTSPSGREYAVIALRQNVGFVDITNPADPSLVASLDAPSSLWRDVKVYQQYAYSVSEGGGGIQVFDLSQIDQGTVVALASVLDGGQAQTHNVAIDTVSGFLYRTGGGTNGLRIYSLANPASPTFVTNWETRYVHDAQVHTFTEGPYAGRQIVYACAGLNGGYLNTGLTIIDVTDKNNIQELSHFQYSFNVYSHQGWLSEDAQYFFLGDELDENRGVVDQTLTRILDVSDLSAPLEVGTFSNGLNAIDHNMYTKGNLLYQANYRSGMRVWDISDPLNPSEIAYFDTYEEDDAPRFNGLWSVYPYFESGTIIGSDMEKGLFIWKLDTGDSSSFLTQQSLMMPWISNSDTFDSSIVVQNTGNDATDVRFSARRADGTQEASATFSIAGRGFLRMQAADLFPGLGIGAGYAVRIESTLATVAARWVTRDKVSLSPSQGLAITTPLDDTEGEELKSALEFGYLPNSDGFFSAMVACHTGSGPADVQFYWFRADGSLAHSATVSQVEPNTPIVQQYTPAEETDLVGIAYCAEAKLAGVVFVFNAEGQTAIGNAKGISDYVPPVQ